MTANTPAASCTLTKEGSPTLVPVKRKCTVTYEFNTSTSNADLALRYLVLVNGNVVHADGGRPRALDQRNRKIVVAVEPGSKVALILNSDVHPDFRRNPVYAVQVNDRNAHVIITERRGRVSHETSKLREPILRACPGNDESFDEYQAALTGDIWMSISNLYSESEANAMLPEDVAPVVRDAVRRIYRGLQTNELLVQFPASDSEPPFIMSVRFDSPSNVLENTTNCPLLTGVLPRTHPRAYAALLTEARACRITVLRVSSGWRPMLGSIVHRAGLGLDINYAESRSQHVNINRAALSVPGMAPNENVSEREKALYFKYEQAKRNTREKDVEMEAARRRLVSNRDPEKCSTLQQQFQAAQEQFDDAKKTEGNALKEWNRERNQNESGLIRTLREGLRHNSSIGQVLDPWYLDLNTKDGIPAVPNEQRNGVEKIHNNHLHITVADSKIL